MSAKRTYEKVHVRSFVTKHIRSVIMLAATVFAALPGCGTTAEIRMVDGRILEGKIHKGDAEAIYIGDSLIRVPRKDIVDIDHPGNGAAITGASLVLYGMLNGFYVMSQFNNDERLFINETWTSVVAFSPAVVGLGLTIWGSAVWLGSTGAAKEGLQHVSVAPLVVPSNQGTLYGGVLALSF
jgi:hypothetical protein